MEGLSTGIGIRIKNQFLSCQCPRLAFGTSFLKLISIKATTIERASHAKAHACKNQKASQSSYSPIFKSCNLNTSKADF